MRKIRFPDLDITGMWVLAVGVFFHLIARLVRKQPGDKTATLSRRTPCRWIICCWIPM